MFYLRSALHPRRSCDNTGCGQAGHTEEETRHGRAVRSDGPPVSIREVADWAFYRLRDKVSARRDAFGEDFIR